MNEVPLICHPQSDAGGVEAIQVAITRSESGEVALTYQISGSLSALKIAALGQPNRVDELWKTTCLELFIGNFEDETYLEYNFAPSSEWAAYKFSGYRAEMAELETGTPSIKADQSDRVVTVSVMLQLPDAWRDRDLRAGLSAVIATKNGNVSYWAAAHPPGGPDFHHKDCFAVQLEARSAA